MDYVVAGFGIGAVLALIGFALWELFGMAEDSNRSWLGRAAIGLMLGAAVIWAITVVLLFSTIDDSTAERLVLLTTLVTLLSIAVVSFWYRHAEQAVAVAQRSGVVDSPASESVVLAGPAMGSGDIEPNEWDTWPARDSGSQADPSEVADTAPAAEFEPEIAAEPTPVVSDTSGGHADPLDEEPPAVPEVASDVLLAEAPAPMIERERDAEVEIESPIVAELPEPLPEPPVADAPAFPEPTTDDTSQPDEERESLVDALASSEPDTANDAPDTPDASSGVTSEVAAEQAIVEDPKPNIAPAAFQPVAFESSLLADIDLSTASESEGGYQSPLLADLDQNADELEKIGLARWRPEDRLESDEPPSEPRAKSRRKRGRRLS